MFWTLLETMDCDREAKSCYILERPDPFLLSRGPQGLLDSNCHSPVRLNSFEFFTKGPRPCNAFNAFWWSLFSLRRELSLDCHQLCLLRKSYGPGT